MKDQEEKHECNQWNKKFLSSDEQEDKRKSHSHKREQDNEQGDPKESSSVAAPNDGVTNNKFDCKVCGKEFRSIKAVHGHTRLHSGRKKAARVVTNGDEEERWSSRRAKKQARAPDSGSSRNQFLNSVTRVGEASRSSPMKRERWSSERKVDVSHPSLVQAPLDQHAIELEIAHALLILSQRIVEKDSIDKTHYPDVKKFQTRFRRFLDKPRCKFS